MVAGGVTVAGAAALEYYSNYQEENAADKEAYSLPRTYDRGAFRRY